MNNPEELSHQRPKRGCLRIIMIAFGVILALIVGTITLFVILSGRPETPHFVDQPESTSILSKTRGTLIINQSFDSAEPDMPRILAVSFPSLRQWVIRHQRNDLIHSVGGPDKHGRIAFVTESDFAKDNPWHRLNTINIDGTDERVVFQRPGDILFSKPTPIGEYLALSPDTNLVAFIRRISHQQHPGAYLAMGPLEIWDLEKSTSHLTGLIALDEQLFWSPDGKELIFATLLPRSSIPNGDSLPDSPYEQTQGKRSERWAMYPVVTAYNLDTKQTRQIAPGHRALLSPDGKRLWTSSGDKSWLYDLQTHTATPQDLPSYWGQPHFLLQDGLALFRAPPAKGSKPRHLKGGSFKVGTQMWAIKIGEVGSWQFQTALPYSDFRDELSIGYTDLSHQPN